MEQIIGHSEFLALFRENKLDKTVIYNVYHDKSDKLI